MSAAVDHDVVEIDVEAWQGHACVGSIVGTGRRVLVGTHDACGECEVCRAGGATVCPLAKPRELSSRIRVMGRWVVALQDGLDLPSPAAAAVPGDVALAYTAYARTSISAADAVVIVGKSPVTRFLVEILRAKAIVPTVVVEGEDDGWTGWLTGKGAVFVTVTTRADAAAQVREAIAGQGRGVRPTRVIATSSDAAELACQLAYRRGTLTLLPTSQRGLDIGLAAEREVTVIGVARAHPDLVVEAAALCVKGEVDLIQGTTTDPGHPTRSHVSPVPDPPP